MLAVVLGTTAATGQGVLVVSVMLGLAFCAIGIAIYVRDPILAFIWLWLFQIFNAPLSAVFGYFSPAGQAVRQANELVVLLFVGLTVWRMIQTKTRLPSARFILPGIGVALFGTLGAIVHSVPLTVTIVGTWLGLKLWIMIGVTLVLPWKTPDITRVYTVLTRVGLFVAALGLVDYVTHSAVSRALHTSTFQESSAYRGNAVHSILAQPGEYSLFMSLLFALTFSRFAGKRSRSDLALALLFAGSVVLSLRLKGFLSLAAIVMVVGLVHAVANHRGSITALFVGVLLVAGVYSVERNVIAKQVSTYTSSESSARARLYTASERIANANFPLGAGFGRFASYASRLYYSPVYAQYELNDIWGLSRAYPDFIDDTSWPSVIGETGYGGLIIYAGGILLLIIAIFGQLRMAPDATRWVPLAALCAMAALLVDSLGDPTLFDWLATTTFAMILGPALVTNHGRQAQRSTSLDPGEESTD